MLRLLILCADGELQASAIILSFLPPPGHESITIKFATR